MAIRPSLRKLLALVVILSLVLGAAVWINTHTELRGTEADLFSRASPSRSLGGWPMRLGRCHGKMGIPKIGDPHPHIPGKMGMGVPVIPVKWGPRIPILTGLWGCLRENGDPYFTGKMGVGSLFCWKLETWSQCKINNYRTV